LSVPAEATSAATPMWAHLPSSTVGQYDVSYSELHRLVRNHRRRKKSRSGPLKTLQYNVRYNAQCCCVRRDGCQPAESVQTPCVSLAKLT